MSSRWRRDFETYRSWGLIRLGFLGVIIGLLGLVEGTPLFTALGAAFVFIGVLSVANGVRLLRRRRDAT